MQDASSLQGQEPGPKKRFGRGSSGDAETQGYPSASQQVCMCHQGLVSRWLKGCISLSLGFEKEISKQMEKDGPGIFPVSASCFLLPRLQGGSGRLCQRGTGAAVPVLACGSAGRWGCGADPPAPQLLPAPPRRGVGGNCSKHCY